MDNKNIIEESIDSYKWYLDLLQTSPLVEIISDIKIITNNLIKYLSENNQQELAIKLLNFVIEIDEITDDDIPLLFDKVDEIINILTTIEFNC